MIPFPKGLVSLLKDYITAKRRDVETQDHGFFFVTDKGLPCYPMLVYRTIKTHLKQTTSEKQSPHVLRHTYATHLLNKGAEINAVKDLLGHSSLAATQIYTHNTIEKLKDIHKKAHPKA